MEDILLYNTLSGKKETLSPKENHPEIGMYNCGPTVYDFAHIGNLRSYVFSDTLRRTLEYFDYKVKQVINITDVGHLTSDADTGEDKIEKGAEREHKTAKEITDFYANAFFGDLHKLNILAYVGKDNPESFPRATAHIAEQISLIQELEKKGFTYNTSDGVYFDTSKFKDYGKLGNINLKNLEEGARVAKNPEKKNVTDFALWKLSKGEKREQEWPSPWGIGFPGWHIECSAMSMKYLGETFDIHTGGIDHIPVHHNNEIAQSESVTGKPLARIWMHNAFISVNGGKMSKSAGGFITLAELSKKGVSPLAFRYWLLTAHYRTPVNFTWEAIEGVEKAWQKLSADFAKMPDGGKPNAEIIGQFETFIKDDLSTPQALALIWQTIKDEDISPADKKATILKMDKVFGLNIQEESEKLKTQNENIPQEVLELKEERERARKEKNWAESDRLRDEIQKLGFEVKDTDGGQVISTK